MGNITRDITQSRSCVIWDGNFPIIFFNSTIEHIRDPDELRKCDFSRFKIIYILAEIKWPGYIRSNFHGFQLGTDLRKKLVKCPIVFCSFMPGFNKGQFPDSKILDFPGHYLLQLPSKPLKLEHYKELDEDTLEDLNISLFDPNQWVHDLIHNTENRCPELAQNTQKKEEIKIRVQNYLFNQLEIFKGAILKDKNDEFEILRGSLLKEIDITIDSNEFCPDKLRRPLNLYKEQLYGFLPTALMEGFETNASPKRWQVLFVDDQHSGCESVSNHFLRNGITCHTAQTAEQAFFILREDENGFGKIAVIISDFRLYVNGDSETGKWQDLQGYQILKQIHSHFEFKSHYAYVILTSKKGTIQQYIKKHSEFPILWFNKTDVLAGEKHSFNIFCQRIIEVGSEAFFRKHNIPDAAVWKKGITGRIDYGYSYFYKQHIESPDFYEIEKEINRKVVENIKYIQSNSELLDSFDYQISLRHKANKMKSREKMMEDNSFDLLSKFRENILVTRRIIWGLCVLLHKDKYEIFELVKKEYSETDDEKDLEGMMSAVFNTSLGISFNPDPSNKNFRIAEKSFKEDSMNHDSLTLHKYGLLIEEIEFLEKNAEQFNANVSFIRLTNNDIEILAYFFSSIIDLYDNKAISDISRKLNTDSKITKEEFDLSLKIIARKNELDGKFSGNFKRATENFYLFYIDELTAEIKNKINKLKYW